MPKDRYYGAELSVVEYEFVFRRENSGFVRYENVKINGKTIRSAVLDPSAFLKSTKREYFLPYDGNSYPPEGEAVKLNVIREMDYKIAVKGEDSWPLINVKLKVYDSWEPVNIREILEKKSHDIYGFPVEREKGFVYDEDVSIYLQAPLKGDPTTIRMLTDALAVFIHSSPPWWEMQGGVLEGAIGNRKHYSALSYVLDLIPPDFRRKSSKYYYNLTRQQSETPPKSAIEANLCYYNPERPVHLPLPLKQEWVKFRAKKEYESQFQDAKPLMRARIVDSVLIRPELESANFLKKANETIVDLARDKGLPCPIDYGNAILRISSGLVRKERKFTIEKRNISKALNLYEILFEDGLKLVKDALSVKELVRMKEKELHVYMTMRDLEAKEKPVSFEELVKATRFEPMVLEEVIKSLLNKSVIYEPKRGYYSIPPFEEDTFR